jgi:hypothetical protein
MKDLISYRICVDYLPIKYWCNTDGLYDFESIIREFYNAIPCSFTMSNPTGLTIQKKPIRLIKCTTSYPKIVHYYEILKQKDLVNGDAVISDNVDHWEECNNLKPLMGWNESYWNGERFALVDLFAGTRFVYERGNTLNNSVS